MLAVRFTPFDPMQTWGGVEKPDGGLRLKLLEPLYLVALQPAIFLAPPNLMGWTALPPALQTESLHQEGEPI
jgi:hypothetical protein